MKSKFLVPFETARRLKEKGYPQESDYMYCAGERHWRHLTLYQMNKINAVAAPTYHEVLDWLVGKKIYIDIDCTAKAKWYCYMWEGNSAIDATGQYFVRELALNAAIIRALEEI